MIRKSKPYFILKEQTMFSFRKTAIILVLVGNVAFGAPANKKQPTLNDVKKNLLNNFAKGSILDGSNKAGNVQRWYLFNEGHVGYSYSKLGKLDLQSVDLGYSMYLTAIRAASGLRPYIGTEITLPIYIKSTGYSNAFYADQATGLPHNTKVLQDMGFNGWGVQVPIIVGVQAQYLYIQGMVGYAYHDITDKFYVSDVQNDTSLNNIYHGLVYGVGVGIKVSNIFSMGFRYVLGQMNSASRVPGAGINTNSIRTKDFTNDYQRFSVIFGVMF